MQWIRRLSFVTILALAASALLPDGFASARSAAGGKADRSAASAYAQARPLRARTRIRVTPAYPYRLYSTTYPVPYEYEYPGPGGVRQCTSWLARENRPSGPVIVPRMRCWWE
jgi:hypothetical protein